MSQLFLRTLREDPADAEVPSHKLLVRAGYIRRTAPGVYSWLPLGLKVLRNVEKVVREEMEGIGAQELAFPALLPREPYEATNRWTEYGPELFRLKDRKGADYLLGPTHEEMFALAVKDLFSSYKDFPTTLFQIQTKYRDEARPRAGILRGREFVMKDSYSFDMDDEGLENSYQLHRGAYQRIFDRLGIKYEICHATSGAMGGSASEEFLAVSENGEDSFVVSTDGEYAANVEAVRIPAVEPQQIEGQPEAKVYESPNCTTIAALVDWANGADFGREVTAADTLKCVLVAVDPKKVDKKGNALPEQLTAILVPGDREVDEKRLEVAFEPGEVRLLEDKDFAANDFLIKGYVGPQGLADHGVKVLADPRVAEGTNWIAGANEEGKHIVDVVAGRDFQIDGICDVAEVRDGDPAPEGHGTLKIERGIEIGHIFQLGRKYTNAFEIDILDVNGKRARPTMGSYGIGVSRLVAVLAEQQLDEKGLKWPVAAAPYKVHIAVAGKNAEAAAAAERLAEDLSQQGIEVLFDDRPKVSPGVKFKDAELLGMPFVVIFGRGYADGKVELRNRLTNETDEVAADGIAAHVAELVRKA